MASDSVFRNPISSHGDRELPEIAANGDGGHDGVHLTKSGTSMAAPAVAGGAALIQQTVPRCGPGPRAAVRSCWRPLGATPPAARGGRTSSPASTASTARARWTPTQPYRSPRAADLRNGPRRPARLGRRHTPLGGHRQRAAMPTFIYQVSVPQHADQPRTSRSRSAWDSKVTELDIFGISLPLSSHLTVDLDLHVRDSAGATGGATARSWNNSYEIAEFGARGGETYEIRIRRWSGTDDVWYGVAWTVTGFDLVLKRLAESSLAALGPR